MEELIITDNSNVIKESAIWAIVGWRGDGKTALLANIAEIDFKLGKTIISNFHLDFPHIRMTFEELVNFPKGLKNATVVLDEFQVGSGSRNSLSNNNKAINKFVTQLRKRNIILYLTTQNFKFIDSDVRGQTDYLITTTQVNKHNEADHRFSVVVIDRRDFRDSMFGTVVNQFVWDASDIFERKIYDTDEIINFGEE